MRRVLLASVLVACGSRSDLSASPSPPASTVCTDALDPAAFTPVLGYCSDHSNRARAVAPAHPHVAWTQPLANAGTNLGLLVDAQSNVYLGDFATYDVGSLKSFDAFGDLRWTAPIAAAFGALYPSTLVVETGSSPWWAKVAESSGAVTPATWSVGGGRVAVRADGSAFVELLGRGALAEIFGGVSRLSASGATLWTEHGDCWMNYGDFLTPHDFVRRDDDLILVCDASDHATVEILEVDGNDVKVSDERIDGGLVGGVALSPDGTLALFISPSPSIASQSGALVRIDRSGNVQLGGPSLATPSVAAVAADGTLIVTSQDGIFAISAGVVRWHQSVTALLFVDDASTIVAVASSTATAFDVATGDALWALPIPDPPVAIASGGPGRVYVLAVSSLTLIED